MTATCLNDETTFPRRDADGFWLFSARTSDESTFWLFYHLSRRKIDAAKRSSRSKRRKTRNAQEYVSFIVLCAAHNARRGHVYRSHRLVDIANLGPSHVPTFEFNKPENSRIVIWGIYTHQTLKRSGIKQLGINQCASPRTCRASSLIKGVYKHKNTPSHSLTRSLCGYQRAVTCAQIRVRELVRL